MMSAPVSVLSDGLHSRVQRFIQSAPQSREAFEPLALEIARFQAAHIPGFARLVEARHSRLDRLDDVPAVPVEAFRLTRIAAHPPDADVVRYATSGTTSDQPGIHAMRRIDTYQVSALTWGRQALLPLGVDRACVVALLAAGAAATSSLAAMAQMFMDGFDPVDGALDGNSCVPTRWLLTECGIDVPLLQAHIERARMCNQPLVIVATAFALARLLDDIKTKRLDYWPQTMVMPTGGFKGKTREISASELRARVARVFGIREENIVGEYGMTELSSQLYEGCLPGACLRGKAGVFHAPPWLVVSPVDPETLQPVPNGELGVARFVDLANVDSALCIVAQDLIRRRGNGIELLGRRQGAPARGCSLSTEDWLVSHVNHPTGENR
jgi:hypothetical protein